MTETNIKELYRPDEVARILGVQRRRVYRWIRRKQIAAIILPGNRFMIPLSEMERILNSGTK